MPTDCHTQPGLRVRPSTHPDENVDEEEGKDAVDREEEEGAGEERRVETRRRAGDRRVLGAGFGRSAASGIAIEAPNMLAIRV